MKIDEQPVSELMDKKVCTVRPSTTLRELIRLMQKTHYHLFPVIDENDTMLGIVNYNEILNIFRPFSRSVSEIVKRMPFVDSMEDEDLNLELSQEMGILIVVDDIINKNFIAVKETTSVKEARRLMRLHKLELLPVLADKKLVGVLSTLDILVYIFKEHEMIDK